MGFETLKKHAPCKKISMLKASNPFFNEVLSKEIMARSRLLNNFLKK